VTFQVKHVTTYHYQDKVSSNYGQMHLLPRSLPGQVCLGTDVVIEPRPSKYVQHTDFFGNNVAYFEIMSPHKTLSVTTTSRVRVNRQLPLVGDQGWETLLLLDGSGEDDGFVSQFCLDSPLAAASGELAEYGRASFTPARPAVEALVDLAERIYADFPYTAGATSVKTTAAEVLIKRKGVCQDFAHLAIGCLRSLGLAARYVSGYLETEPPPGKPRIPGADVSHAWASLFVPGAGWVDVDPTNHQLVNDRYITTAWGRDFGDVPPLQGVIFTEGTTHDLEVMVDVIRVPDG
jgi:transglutaminase-like putative cysteine protease